MCQSNRSISSRLGDFGIDRVIAGGVGLSGLLQTARRFESYAERVSRMCGWQADQYATKEPVTKKICWKCFGTGTWAGERVSRPCYDCYGQGFRDTAANPCPHNCRVCGEPVWNDDFLCRDCFRSAASAREINADLMFDEGRGSELCYCERDYAGYWTQGKRVCRECWEEYIGQLDVAGDLLIRSEEPLDLTDHLMECNEVDCEICDELVAA